MEQVLQIHSRASGLDMGMTLCLKAGYDDTATDFTGAKYKQ